MLNRLMNCSSDTLCSGTFCGARRAGTIPSVSGSRVLTWPIRRIIVGLRRTGRIQSAERAKPTLEQLHDYTPENLLSACDADTGDQRKGDFDVKATPAES